MPNRGTRNARPNRPKTMLGVLQSVRGDVDRTGEEAILCVLGQEDGSTDCQRDGEDDGSEDDPDRPPPSPALRLSGC